MTKACAQCGADFLVNPRVGNRQKFCSTSCNNLAQRHKEPRRNPWTERICRHCGATFQRAGAASGAQRYCTPVCKQAAASARFYDQRWKHIARRYGVQPAIIEQMMTSQDGACAICRTPLLGRGLERDAPQVDHDHKTGLLRAILCRPCNTALGMFRDDPELVETAVAYLRMWAAEHSSATG